MEKVTAYKAYDIHALLDMNGVEVPYHLAYASDEGLAEAIRVYIVNGKDQFSDIHDDLEEAISLPYEIQYVPCIVDSRDKIAVNSLEVLEQMQKLIQSIETADL